MFIVMELVENEIQSLQLFTDKQVAESQFESIVQETQLHEESVENEIHSTLRIAGDDVYSVHLLVREPQP